VNESFMVFVPGKAPEGPYDVVELRRRRTAGLLLDVTQVCRVGGDRWVPIETVLVPEGKVSENPAIGTGSLSAAASVQQSLSRAHGIAIVLFGLVAVVVTVIAVAMSQTDKAEPEFIAARTLEKGDDVQKTMAAFESARSADPTSKCGKRAAEKLTELEPKYKAWRQADNERIAKVAKAAVEAEAAAAKIRYHDMAKKLNDKIHQQAMWDLGRGTVTNVIDVITGEMGQPAASYEGSYGAIHSFVWGAQLGSSPTVDQIQGAPFCARMFRGLTCGDYADGSVEFYSYGQQLRFWLAE
jgi:hypothetical protein